MTETAPSDPVLAAGLYNGRNDITELIVPEGVSEIGAGTFSGMRALTSVTLPSTLRVVGESAFAECGSLKELAIPEGVELIGAEAFADCAQLQKLTVPPSVTSLGENLLWLSNNGKAITVTCEKGSFADGYFKNGSSQFWKVKLKYKKWK